MADSSHWYFAYGNIGISADDITVDGQITFRCDDVLDRDLTVDIMQMNVNIEDDSNVGKVFNLISNDNLRIYIDKRFSDLCNALTNEDPFHFILGDSENKTLLDSAGNGVFGRVILNSSD